MDDAQDSASAGRQLAAARWGDRVLRSAVEVVIARADQLDAELTEQLRTAIDQGGGSDE